MNRLYAWLKAFEHTMIRILIVLMALVIFIATIELGYIVIKDIISPPIFLLEIEELLDIFGFFLLILISRFVQTLSKHESE